MIELLIVLMISVGMSICVPIFGRTILQSYQSHVFYSQFEAQLKQLQVEALVSNEDTRLAIRSQEKQLTLNDSHGNEKVMNLPSIISVEEDFIMGFKAGSGNPSQFKTLTFHQKNKCRIYHFQLGGARYYVEEKS